MVFRYVNLHPYRAGRVNQTGAPGAEYDDGVLFFSENNIVEGAAAGEFDMRRGCSGLAKYKSTARDGAAVREALFRRPLPTSSEEALAGGGGYAGGYDLRPALRSRLAYTDVDPLPPRPPGHW